MNHPDPFLDGAIRLVRANSQDGLGDLGHAAVLLLCSTVAALKLWWPLAAQSLTLPLMVLIFASPSASAVGRTGSGQSSGPNAPVTWAPARLAPAISCP